VAHSIRDLWKTKKGTSVPTVFLGDGEGGFLPLAEQDTSTTMLHPIRETGGWCVTVKHRTRDASAEQRRSWLLPGRREPAPEATTLRGDAAQRALATLVPYANGYGGNARHVRDAMGVIEAKASLHRLIYDAATIPGLKGATDGANYVTQLPAPVRLALAMVLHDEDEQRAMQGELAALVQRWKDAEQIASIADALLLPPDTESRFDALKRRLSSDR
jgi:hypothetical protein